MTDNVVSIGVSKRSSSVAGTLPLGGATLFNIGVERERHMARKSKEERLFEAAASIAEYEGVGYRPIRMMMEIALSPGDRTVRGKAATWLWLNCNIPVADEDGRQLGSRARKRRR